MRKKLRTVGPFFIVLFLMSVTSFSANPVCAEIRGEFMSQSPMPILPDVGLKSGEPAPGYTIGEKSYFTDNMGNVLMYINVWGAFGKTGRFPVPQNIDIITMLSMVGGPSEKAKLSKMIVYRQEPDEFGKQLYLVDLKKLIKHGDATDLVELRPNDTIVMPVRSDTNIFKEVMNTAGSVFSILNYINN